MKTPHTAAKKGTRIKVILRDGTTFIDKFSDRKSQYLLFDNHKVNRDAIRAFIIYKGV